MGHLRVGTSWSPGGLKDDSDGSLRSAGKVARIGRTTWDVREMSGGMVARSLSLRCCGLTARDADEHVPDQRSTGDARIQCWGDTQLGGGYRKRLHDRLG
jgi:hypothetical protein